MQFQPGESGNPNGRPKGTGYRQQIFDRLVTPRADELVDFAIKSALNGNETMLRLFLERLLPARPHAEPLFIELPEDLTKDKFLLTMGEIVLKGIASQELTPAQGKAILELAEEQKRLAKMQKHDDEMAAILGKLG